MDLKYVNNEFKNLLTEMATFSLELKNQFSTLEKSHQKRFITSYLTIYEINISFSSKNDTNLGNIVHSIVFSFFIAEMNSKSCENDDYLIFSNKISEFLSLNQSKELKINDYYLLFKNRCKAFKKLEYYHDVPFENSIINYYEFFISKVDQITKNKHGLFYTPISVVTFILKGIDYILREEFNEKYGFCSIKKDKFMLLDPAMGPGIFIFQYIDFLEKIFSHKPNLKLNKLEFYKNLFNSISGIELLPESYIIFKLLLDTKLV
ncbi:MAG: N-6 DNA methylase, partial [Candidatus Heimdallarchaeota archaeon]